MNFAPWGVGRLVLVQGQNLASVGDFCGASRHNPALGMVVVLLQAQAGFGLDLNAFDFEAATFVDAVVPAPRPM